MKRCVLHLPPHMVGLAHPQAGGFYGDLCRVLGRVGLEPSFDISLTPYVDMPLEEGAFHIVHASGRSEQQRGANVLYTAQAALRDFWYMDPKGTGALSSLRDAVFDPDALPEHRVAQFFERQQRRGVNARLSKHAQPQAEQNFGKGHVAVFLERPDAHLINPVISDLEMVQAVRAQVSDRQILVKPHPQGVDPDTLAALRRLAQHDPALHVVEANVHDMLNGAALCVNLGSMVSIEAMLHQVPVLVLSDTDFHHCAQVASSADQIGAAAEEAMARDWPYAEYLFWFLRQYCLDLSGKGWMDKAEDRIETALSDLW